MAGDGRRRGQQQGAAGRLPQTWGGSEQAGQTKLLGPCRAADEAAPAPGVPSSRPLPYTSRGWDPCVRPPAPAEDRGNVLVIFLRNKQSHVVKA